MEMREILKEMETNLANQKAVVTLYESRVKILQEAFDKAEKAMLDEIDKLKTAKDDAYATEQAIEMLKMGSFAQQKAAKETTVKAEVTDVKADEKKAGTKKTENRKRTERSDVQKHKGAYVLQLNKYDNVMDRWPSQKAAARNMRWDQSSVSKFMKLDKDVQLKKKGFYLAWEY